MGVGTNIFVLSGVYTHLWKYSLFIPLYEIAFGELVLSYLMAEILGYSKSLARVLTNTLWDYGIFI